MAQTLAERAPSDHNEPCEFRMRVPPESFRDVVGRRIEGRLEVVAKSAICLDAWSGKDCTHFFSERAAQLISAEIVVVSDGHAARSANAAPHSHRAPSTKH